MYLRSPEPRWQGHYFDVKRYMRSVPQMLEHLRTRFGNELELCVDIHERLLPSDAMQVAKWVELYRLMYLEDALPPEESAWFRRIRACCATPLAMGELFTALLADWRRYARAKAGGLLRSLRRKDGMARAQRSFSHRLHGEFAP